MPRIELTEEQITEVVDLVAKSIALQAYREDDPDYVECRHRASVLLEIMEILEDA